MFSYPQGRINHSGEAVASQGSARVRGALGDTFTGGE